MPPGASPTRARSNTRRRNDHEAHSRNLPTTRCPSVIHASGTTTRYGGSLLRPEALEAMREASQALVNIDELNAAAGAAIARMLGAEAAFVTAGASSGLDLAGGRVHRRRRSGEDRPPARHPRDAQ